MSFNDFFNEFIKIISLPAMQALFSFLSVTIAFLSVLRVFTPPAPKVKIKPCYRETDKEKYTGAFAFSKSGPIAVSEFYFENFTPHKTQIYNVWFTYKGKNYYASSAFVDYKSLKRSASVFSTSEYKLRKEMFFTDVPFSIESFEKKRFNLTFYDFPETDKNLLTLPVYISIAGRKKPKVSVAIFKKVDISPYSYEYDEIINGKTVTVLTNAPIKKDSKVITRKR